MSEQKEKSAVGMAIPATEKDINYSPENIISATEEKIKRFGGKNERRNQKKH